MLNDIFLRRMKAGLGVYVTVSAPFGENSR